MSVDLDQTVVSYKFKHNGEGFEYFIGYQKGEIVKPLCIIFTYKYLKAKIREFDGVIKTNFLENGMPKENMYYSGIPCIAIDSVMNIDKKNHLQVYLEQCKYSNDSLTGLVSKMNFN